MNKTKLTFALMFVAGAFAAGNFVACSKSNPPATGTAGTSGSAGTTGAGGSTGGTPGTGSGGMTDGGAALPDGKCVTGAFPRDGGICVCQSDTPDVCGTACTDKKTDNDNCGTCGTKCGATQTCNAGVCGPMPTVVLPAVTGCTAFTLATATDGVYYADEGHGSISKVGGTAPIVASGEMAPTWLAAQGANLFWYNKGNKTIRKVATAGGTPATVYTNTAVGTDGGAAPDVGGFVVSADGATLYVSLGTQVIKLPVAGGASSVVANEAKGGLPGALALVGTTNIVYPTGGNVDLDAPLLSAAPATCGLEDANGDVIMMPTAACASCACPRLGRSQGALLMDFMTAIGTRAFWVSETEVRSEVVGATGGTYEHVSSTDNNISAAAASTDSIYFASDDPNTAKSGVISRTAAAANPNNTPAVLLARGQPASTSVAVDATKVYWAGADCTISSIAK